MYVIDFLEQRRTLSKEQFVARHPDPVLVLQSPELQAASGASGPPPGGGLPGSQKPGPATVGSSVAAAAAVARVQNVAQSKAPTGGVSRFQAQRAARLDEDSEESTLVGGPSSYQPPVAPRPKPSGGTGPVPVGSGGHDTLTTLASLKSNVLLRKAAEAMLVLPVRKTGVNLYQDKITVGRASNNDVILASASVSKFHAYFRRGEDARYLLTDGGSKNGTFINWQPVEARKATPVKDGMELIFGEVSTRYHEPGGFFEFLGRFLAAQ